MTRFVSRPYAYLGYYQLSEATDFEITMYNRNAGIQFSIDGIYETENEAEIKAIRDYIKARHVDITEYVEGMVKEEPKPIVPKIVDKDCEAREKLINLLRL